MQGVGFRPFVFRLAQNFNLNGWVNNSVDGLHIEFNAEEAIAKKFYSEIISKAPPLAHITAHSLEERLFIAFEGFHIRPSSAQQIAGLQISPDYAMCGKCRQDIADINNRRYHYAFTTCTQCGPRYSIMTHLPYDREHTSMAEIEMCNSCNNEYNDPLNRRHFSQTNSCPQCPVVMKLFDNRHNLIEESQGKIISKICELWDNGFIVAIKGIGGYLLTCNAGNSSVVSELRKRKQRPSKPFAVMFPDMISLEQEVHLSRDEVNEVKNTAAPILLLRLKNNLSSALALDEIAPGLSSIGAMLPYAPLYQLLMQQYAKPIIATSGNVSNAPIIYKDEVALNELSPIADYVLMHNRAIIAPQDDSVVVHSIKAHQRIFIRRARGFAPFYDRKDLILPAMTILSMGALLKSSFTLLHQQNIHVSQYLGDTTQYDAQENYNISLQHYLHLFRAQPQVVIVEQHPDYFSNQLGKQHAKNWGSQFIRVQHHEAHFASVLGEHNLVEDTEPILGVIWDGTGLGSDGQIWGGEFFRFHRKIISRESHFQYFNHILGDKMAYEPRLSAFSLCYEIEEAASILMSKFSAPEWINYHQIIKNNQLKTSSLGRIFDAVASLLGLIDKSGYEGEAAMLLEEEGLKYFKDQIEIPLKWLENKEGAVPLNVRSILQEIIYQINTGTDKSQIAAYFHVWLISIVQKIAAENKYQKICFSGGVFQNKLLVDLIIKMLGANHQLYFNAALSPNDENISFGQLMHYLIREA